MRTLKSSQLAFLKAHELCRLATASKAAVPQVTPVIYTVDGEDVIIAVDYGEKKLQNLRENPKVALVVDEFGPNNKAVAIQGRCEVFESGEEYLRLQKLLYQKFELYRRNPWKEGESPILKIRPKRCASWGI